MVAKYGKKDTCFNCAWWLIVFFVLYFKEQETFKQYIHGRRLGFANAFGC